MLKARAITHDEDHPLFDTLLPSGLRFVAPRATKNRYRFSFVPASIRALNSANGRWTAIAWQSLRLESPRHLALYNYRAVALLIVIYAFIHFTHLFTWLYGHHALLWYCYFNLLFMSWHFSTLYAQIRVFLVLSYCLHVCSLYVHCDPAALQNNLPLGDYNKNLEPWTLN